MYEQDVIWGAVGEPLCRWREWKDGTVVYNEATGDTHRLNSLASEIFHELRAEPASLKHLAERIARKAGIEIDEDLSHGVTAIIRQLRGFGLVESCESAIS